MLHRDDVLDRYTVADRTRPHLRMNFISSLDGSATQGGLSGGLNNADDKLVFDTLRMLSDVILLGAGTLRDEGYGAMRLDDEAVRWRVEHGLAPQPTFALVSSRLGLPPTHPVFADAPVRPLVLTHDAALPEARDELASVADVVLVGSGAVDPWLLRGALEQRGLLQVLCEGGPHLFGSFLAADAVDELCLTLSPVLEGGHAGRIAVGPEETPRRMHLASVLQADDMLLLRYLRRLGDPATGTATEGAAPA